MINITEQQLREVVTQAHMAGQHNQAHCDPSYYEAEVHWQKKVKNNACIDNVSMSEPINILLKYIVNCYKVINNEDDYRREMIKISMKASEILEEFSKHSC